MALQVPVSGEQWQAAGASVPAAPAVPRVGAREPGGPLLPPAAAPESAAQAVRAVRAAQEARLVARGARVRDTPLHQSTWGQHVDRQGFTDRVTGALYHIWLHEYGHGIGFPDYYDWDAWAPGVDAPACVMNAGAAFEFTEWDKWMFRRNWSELRASGRWD